MALFQMRLSAETDGDIIAWLDAQENKTQAVKDAIRATMGSTPGSEPAAIDLYAIRYVFETVLDERLAGVSLAPGDGDAQEDAEIAAKLDAMF